MRVLAYRCWMSDRGSSLTSFLLIAVASKTTPEERALFTTRWPAPDLVGLCR